MRLALGGELPGGSAPARLAAALAARGHEVSAAPIASGEDAALLVTDLVPGGFAGHATAARLLVLGRIGTHRDSRVPALRALWDLEERARATGLPSLTLRLGPMLGPASPLWRKLARKPALPRDGRQLVNPVAEEDVVETLGRALAGRAAWEGWYEVAGEEAWTLAELRDLARSAPPPPGPAGWEPPLEELAAHRLAEAGPWLEHFGLAAPPPLAERARAWTRARRSAA